MTQKQIKIFVAAFIVISSVVVLVWIFYNPTDDFIIYTPGLDKLEQTNDSVSDENVKIGEFFQKFDNYSSTLSEKWTMFRGPNHDNILKTNYRINENWNKNEPKIVWSVETGEGHAAPIIYDGLVYFIDYNETEKADILKCFSLETGKEIWRRWYKVHVKRNHGMSRTIPAVNENVIVTIGPRCHVMCVDRISGEFKWGFDLEKEYKTETPLWYTGQCPLIVDNTAIIAPCGSSLLIGVDCSSGKVIWETPNEKGWKMSHSSIIPMTIAEKSMFVYASIGGICGISAEKDDLGKLLWELTEWSPSVIAPSPVYIGDNKIFVTGGYGAGGAIIQLTEENNSFKAKLFSKFAPNEGLASEQQTPIVNNGFIYGILPKDAGVNRNQFVCYKTNDLNNPVWQSSKTNRYGLGPYIQINDKFLILDDDGTLSMIKASENSFSLINQKKFFDGQDAWGPFAFADGYLLLRDSKKIYCLNLRE